MFMKPNLDVGFDEGRYTICVYEDIRKAFIWVIWNLSMKPFIDLVSDFKNADTWVGHIFK